MAHHRWNKSGAPVKINKKILHTTGIKPLQIQLFGSTIIGRIEAEADRLRHVIGRDDYVIALCIEGKKTTTEGLADQVRKASERGHDTVTFVIGGSLGLAADIVRRADYRMSVSDMTFPHQLIRVTLAEQLAIISRS